MHGHQQFTHTQKKLLFHSKEDLGWTYLYDIRRFFYFFIFIALQMNASNSGGG